MNIFHIKSYFLNFFLPNFCPERRMYFCAPPSANGWHSWGGRVHFAHSRPASIMSLYILYISFILIYPIYCVEVKYLPILKMKYEVVQCSEILWYSVLCTAVHFGRQCSADESDRDSHWYQYLPKSLHSPSRQDATWSLLSGSSIRNRKDDIKVYSSIRNITILESQWEYLCVSV